MTSHQEISNKMSGHSSVFEVSELLNNLGQPIQIDSCLEHFLRLKTEIRLQFKDARPIE
jgi:hypothetical protein